MTRRRYRGYKGDPANRVNYGLTREGILRAPKKVDFHDGAVHIYTDGSCYPNPGPGGWAARLQMGTRIKEIWGGAKDQTNNTMELSAILFGLRIISQDALRVKIYADSKYAIQCVTQWWPTWQRRDWHTASGSPVKNKELIVDIVTEIKRFDREPIFYWTKGHAGQEHNERVDYLAGLGRKTWGQHSGNWDETLVAE